MLGLHCRYDQSQKPYDEVIKFLKDKPFIPVCPEQMGGLSTPRIPCEIVSRLPLKVMSAQGKDCTEFYEKGVNEVLKLIEISPVNMAILKAKSPSCGSKEIYDGTFSKTLTTGKGLLSQALEDKNIRVYNEKNFKSR